MFIQISYTHHKGPVCEYLQKNRMCIKYPWNAIKCGRYLFAYKLLITAYYNIHIHTHEIKYEETKINYKKYCLNLYSQDQ